MNQALNISKIIAFSAISLVAAVLLWPYSVAGLVAYFVSGMRFNRLVSSIVALFSVIAWRLTFGEWLLQVGVQYSDHWHAETFFGVVNWALAAIFVTAFAKWPSMFEEGYKTYQGRSA